MEHDKKIMTAVRKLSIKMVAAKNIRERGRSVLIRISSFINNNKQTFDKQYFLHKIKKKETIHGDLDRADADLLSKLLEMEESEKKTAKPKAKYNKN